MRLPHTLIGWSSEVLLHETESREILAKIHSGVYDGFNDKQLHHMAHRFKCLTYFRILKRMIILDIKITFVSDRFTSAIVVDLFSRIFLFF
jgi:hypothetical protein